MKRGPKWRIEGRPKGSTGPYVVLVRLRKEPDEKATAFWRTVGYEVVVVRER